MNKTASNGFKVRESNFELLRLLAIGLVIFSHFNLWSFTLENASTDFNFNVLLRLLFTAGCIANIIFIILSGYFLIRSHIKYSKIIALVLEMLFYSVLLLLLAKFVFGMEIRFSDIKNALLPFPFGNWFVVSYIVLYLLSPYLNKLVFALKKLELRRFILVYFFLFSVVPIITGWNYFSNFAVFPLVYFIGAYIRLYVGRLDKAIIIRGIIIVSCLLAGSVVAIYAFALFIHNTGLIRSAVYLLAKNYSPLVIIMGVLIFLLFREIKIGYCPAINRLAGSVLGIYLIHENPFIRKLLWSGNFIPVSIESDILPFTGLACLKVSIVYVACLLFDQIRILLLGRLETRLSSAICRGMVLMYLRFPLRRHLKKMNKLL